MIGIMRDHFTCIRHVSQCLSDFPVFPRRSAFASRRLSQQYRLSQMPF